MEPRTPERIRHHYEVERELAAKLRASSPAQRTELFKTLYTELFERVPDHPRVVRRETPEDSRRKVEGQLRLLRPFLTTDSTLLEIAPGDCRLAHAASRLCGKVIGVDISDQQGDGAEVPDNFSLKVYDGYQVDLPDAVADVAFSYQFLEHLHPDDVEPHLRLVHRLLKPGGSYVLDTPHRFSGPHDISRYFGDELVCFHFQEWTFRSLEDRLKSAGFGDVRVFRGGCYQPSRLVAEINKVVESVVGILPSGLRKAISGRIYKSVTIVGRR
ncbi:class I SAM-dependent methyltransferase [Akkermansiaceae bacterium]|nr:class I SAM-dependent methyltransferase [Akkermansiaceae bacterium]